MFERFTKDARAVVHGRGGRGRARRRAGTVDRGAPAARPAGPRGQPRLLRAGALDSPTAGSPCGPPARPAAGAASPGPTRTRWPGLGIDLTEIVSRVEEAHGVGGVASRGGRVPPGAARAARPGHRPFSRDAKEVLEQVPAHRPRPPGPPHRRRAPPPGPAPPAPASRPRSSPDHGVTYEAVERVLYGGGEAEGRLSRAGLEALAAG